MVFLLAFVFGYLVWGWVEDTASSWWCVLLLIPVGMVAGAWVLVKMAGIVGASAPGIMAVYFRGMEKALKATIGPVLVFLRLA